MVLRVDLDRLRKILPGLFETSGLVQQVSVIHKGGDIIWRDLQKRAKGITCPGQHPEFLERKRQIVLDAGDIGALEAALMGLYLDFQETLAMTDALPVLFEVGMRCSKREMQVQRVRMIGKKVVGDRNDGAELAPLQQPPHHVPETGGNVACLFRIHRREVMAAVRCLAQRPVGNGRRKGKGRRQVCRMGVFVTPHRGLLRPVNDALA